MNPTFEFKKLDSRVKTPTLGTKGAAAFDLQAARIVDSAGNIKKITQTIKMSPGETIKIGTGIAVHMCRPDIAAMILPRSGRGTKGLVIGNLVGLIDSDYQGELIVCLWNRSSGQFQLIEPLERIAQIMFVPILQVGFTEVEEFSEESERGECGFGSSGNK